MDTSTLFLLMIGGLVLGGVLLALRQTPQRPTVIYLPAPDTNTEGSGNVATLVLLLIVLMLLIILVAPSLAGSGRF